MDGRKAFLAFKIHFNRLIQRPILCAKITAIDTKWIFWHFYCYFSKNVRCVNILYFLARTWRIPSISIPQCFLSMIEGLKVKGSCGGLLQGKKKKPEWAAIKLPLPPSVFSPPSDDKTRRASNGPGLEISRVRVGLIFTFSALLARLFWPKNAFTLRSGLCPTPSLPCAVVPPPPTAMEPSIRLPPPPFLLLYCWWQDNEEGKE